MARRVGTVIGGALVMLLAACDGLVTTPTRYAMVDVKTTRRDGTPVGNVPLVLSTGQRVMGYDTTDANGTARFTLVPEGPAYGVLAGQPTGYERLESLLGGSVSDFVPFSLTRSETPLVQFQFLKVGPGTVTAKVVDQAAAPMTGVEVELYAPTRSVDKKTTGTDGRVTFASVPFGAYGVRAFRPAAYRDDGEPVTLDVNGLIIEDGVTETRTLALQRCAGTVSLQVSDAVRGPAANVRTQLFSATGVVGAAKTGTGGSVQYTGVDCGGYGVRILPAAEWVVTPGRGLDFADGLVLHRGTTRTATLPVQYNTCRGGVRVTVVDGQGIAVPGAGLSVTTTYDDPVVTQTSGNGPTLFSALGCGPYRTITVTAPTGYVTTPGRGGSYLDQILVQNGVTQDVQFVLNRSAR